MKLDKKGKIKIVIFILIILVVTSSVIYLIFIDMKKANEKMTGELQKEYFDKLMRQVQQAKDEKENNITFDEASKDLPELDKIDFDVDK